MAVIFFLEIYILQDTRYGSVGILLNNFGLKAYAYALQLRAALQFIVHANHVFYLKNWDPNISNLAKKKPQIWIENQQANANEENK